MSVSQIDEFKTVEQLKQELLMVNRELKAAMITIDRLLKDASQKNEKITQLEVLVAQNVPVISKEKDKLIVSTVAEEEIAEMQLDRLRQIAKTRILSLEETRMYDLLVKNKRLSMDKSTLNLGKNQYRDVSESDLIKLAATEVKVIEAGDESDSE